MGVKKKKKILPKPEPRILRIYRREGGRCFWCRRRVLAPWYRKYTDGIVPLDFGTEDHLLPRSRGGPTEEYNVVLACYKCNNKRGHYLINPHTGEAISPRILWIFWGRFVYVVARNHCRLE